MSSNNKKQYHNQAASSVSDEILLDSIAKGDEKAFAVLYKRYCPILQRFCSRILNGDTPLAADIVDEAMFEVWRSAGRFAGKSKPSTWIHSIARNKLIDFLRKNSDRKIDKDMLKASIDDFVPSEESSFADSNHHELIRYMDKLSPDHRDVLLLAYFRELSVKEMATTLNISENTVKTRLFYARQKFKKILLKTGLYGSRGNRE